MISYWALIKCNAIPIKYSAKFEIVSLTLLTFIQKITASIIRQIFRVYTESFFAFMMQKTNWILSTCMAIN